MLVFGRKAVSVFSVVAVVLASVYVFDVAAHVEEIRLHTPELAADLEHLPLTDVFKQASAFLESFIDPDYDTSNWSPLTARGFCYPMFTKDLLTAMIQAPGLVAVKTLEAQQQPVGLRLTMTNGHALQLRCDKRFQFKLNEKLSNSDLAVHPSWSRITSHKLLTSLNLLLTPSRALYVVHNFQHTWRISAMYPVLTAVALKDTESPKVYFNVWWSVRLKGVIEYSDASLTPYLPHVRLEVFPTGRWGPKKLLNTMKNAFASLNIFKYINQASYKKKSDAPDSGTHLSLRTLGDKPEAQRAGVGPPSPSKATPPPSKTPTSFACIICDEHQGAAGIFEAAAVVATAKNELHNLPFSTSPFRNPSWLKRKASFLNLPGNRPSDHIKTVFYLWQRACPILEVEASQMDSTVAKEPYYVYEVTFPAQKTVKSGPKLQFLLYRVCATAITSIRATILKEKTFSNIGKYLSSGCPDALVKMETFVPQNVPKLLLGKTVRPLFFPRMLLQNTGRLSFQDQGCF